MRLRFRGREYDHNLIDVRGDSALAIPRTGLTPDELRMTRQDLGDSPGSATLIFLQHDVVADGQLNVRGILHPATQTHVANCSVTRSYVPHTTDATKNDARQRERRHGRVCRVARAGCEPINESR
jgi:hypothetical protein